MVSAFLFGSNSSLIVHLGAFGVVSLVREKGSNQLYAMKQVRCFMLGIDKCSSTS